MPRCTAMTSAKMYASSKKSLRRKDWLRFADARHAMFPAFVAAEDLNFDPQEIDWHFHLRVGQAWHANRIFLRRDNHFQVAPDTTIDKTEQLSRRVTVMVDVTLGE